MDPLTHYLGGWLAGKRLHAAKPYWKLLVFSALLPDIDIFLIVFGWEYLGWHAIYTHTLAGIAGFALPLLLIFHFLYKVDMIKAIPFYLGGFLLHLFLDIFNWQYLIGYSQRFLWPLSAQTFNLFYAFGIPPYSSLGLSIYLSIFTMALITFLYFILKKDYPWALWNEEIAFLKRMIVRTKT
ncbi:MAG TPA: metal-dependent hydrolase [Candidatus Bilamarchaeaceae archaeon]|nr:metal-dependent hydrolase [Candidatus Bilamarchaeaceae archaeon]